MNKSIMFVILAGFIALMIGCHAGGSSPLAPNNGETVVSPETRTVGANGRFTDITFPSGAVIKCPSDSTFQEGVKVTAAEQKVPVITDNSGKFSYIYVYNISAVLPSDNTLTADVPVKTIEKPLSVTIPNDSTAGTCYIGTRASDKDQWRYSLVTDGVSSNARFMRLSANPPKTCTFNLFRLNVEFRLFVFDNESKKDEVQVDTLTLAPAEDVEIKDGKYTGKLTVKLNLEGENLKGLKAEDLIAKITYRSENQQGANINFTTNKVDSDDKAVSGSYEHSFEVSNIKVENTIGNTAELSFELNLDGVSLEDFPKDFLVEFYSKGGDENTRPFEYTLAFSFETKENQDNPDNPDPDQPSVMYTITYNLDGGEPTGNNPDKYGTASDPITLSNPKKDGYIFLGWTGSNGNTPQTEVKIAKGSTGAKEYTANWSLDVYEITYNNIDFCTFEKDNPTTYDITSASITLTNPTRTGCEFLGWTYDGQTTPTKTVKIEKGTTGNKEFTANFKLNLTLTIAQDEGAIIDEVNKLYYTKSTFTITPNLAAGAQLTDTEKATILAALSVEDSENKSVSDISADWNNDGNIALAFSKDLTASTTFTISFGKIAGGNLTCEPKTFKTFYYKGKGTTQVPYQVENDEQLDLIREYLSCHFIQTEDINLANRNWEAIGSMDDKFTGSYDGNQKKIEKFTTSNGSGLFYMVSNGGKISNITVDGVSISNGNEIGIIAWGLDANCSIENCVVTDSSATSRSDTNSNIIGMSIGGICNTSYGSIKSCIIEKCNINNTNTRSIGGICYENTNSGSIESCQVKDCNIKSTSSTSSRNDSIGGICCYCSGSITKCDLINSCILLSHTDEYSGDYKGRVGGICCSSDGKINNCSVKNSEISCSTSSGIMKIGGICNSYTNNSDFLTNCSVENTTINCSNANNKCYIGGICCNPDNTTLSSCFVKDSTITGTSNSNYCGVAGISAMGSNFTLTNCYIDNTSITGTFEQGFVSGIANTSNNNTIESCYVKNGSIIKGIGEMNSIGGICAYPFSDTITSCYVKDSSLQSEGDQCAVGGIFGGGNNGQITKCYVVGTSITANGCKNSVGGICGSFASVFALDSCYVKNTTLNVEGGYAGGENYVGGISGKNLATIKACYFYHETDDNPIKNQSESYLGLLLGNNYDSQSYNTPVSISDCFTNISDTLFGDAEPNDDYATETNCYGGIDENNFTNQAWSNDAWSDYNTSVFPPTLNP